MKATAATLPANAPDQVALPAEPQEHIRKRAYEIFEQNGRREGFAEQDWFQAEAEILSSGILKVAA